MAPGEHVTCALEIAESIASFPQATLRADRWGLFNELDQRMEFTAQRDVRTLKEVAGDAEQASARSTSGGGLTTHALKRTLGDQVGPQMVPGLRQANG